MDLKTFNAFRSLVYENSGIALGDSKETLVSVRLRKRMRALGIEHYKAYLDYVQDHMHDGEIVHLLNAICTNFTSFFREPDHFDFLKQAIDKWIKRGQRKFRIWSAACSTGEEPYTIALNLLEAAEGRFLDMKILATDLSTKALDRAQQGIYGPDQVRPIPVAQRRRYFKPVRAEDGTTYQINPVLKDMVLFKRLNLSTPPFPMRGPLDVVFCRNVMIYFDRVVQARLIDEAYRLLKPGGYFIVGHSEGLTGVASRFERIKPSVYIKGFRS